LFFLCIEILIFLFQTVLGCSFYCFLALWVYSTYFNGYVVGCELFFSAYLVIPYCPVCFVQFFSGVSILICLLCLFGIDELYVHVTVHRKKFLFNKINKTHEFPKFYFFKKLYIIRSFLLYNRHCYISCSFDDDSFQAGSGWNWLYSVLEVLYTIFRLVFVFVFLCIEILIFWFRQYWVAVFIVFWHCEFISSRVRMFHPDPAWKLLSNLQEIYQCRMYSRKLLMMDKGNARNM